MKKININQAAKILYYSRVNRKKINKLPKECSPKNAKDAYSIQDALNKIYFKNLNSKIIGKKIGCTNKEAQKQININEPFYGNIYSKFYSKTKCHLKFKDFISPFLEPEFSFRINKNINKFNYPISIKQIKKFIDCIIPSVELVDSRFSDWTKAGIFNLIADNGVNAYWIKGNEFSKIIDLTNHQVEVFINNKFITKGNSNKVLGNPFNSLSWLINFLIKQDKELKKNDLISTGTCTPALRLSKNDEVKVNFGSLGMVEFIID